MKAGRISAAILACAAASAARSAEVKPVKLELKAGQALALAATVVDGKVVLGAARAGKFGEMIPADGEITVGLSPKDKTLYENVVVVEKTAKPIDFVATGLIGNIKIDEIVLKGKLEAPVSARIGAVSWTVWLNSFEPAAK